MCCHDYDSVYVHIRESPYSTYLIIRAIFKLDEYLIWYQLLRYVRRIVAPNKTVYCAHISYWWCFCVCTDSVNKNSLSSEPVT